MPIFYLDSGSIDRLEISSSLLVSGSFIVSGSMNTTGGLTGSLQGTASWATNALTASFAPAYVLNSQTSSMTVLSASFSSTSSFIQNAQSASYVLQAVSASFATSASRAISSSIAVSSSYALTSSFALSASWAPGGSGTITIQDEGSPQGSADTINFTGAGVTATVVGNTATVNIPGGSGQTFPFTGSAIITGSLVVTGSTDILGALTVDVDSIPDLLSAGGFIGNQNNYVELYAQNLSSGVSASTDIVAYADNASETSNFIDLGINSSGTAIGYSFGNANDSYVYNSGGNLFIGNNTAFSQPTVSEQSLFLFANASGSPDLTITGSRVGIRKSGSLNNTLDVNGGVTVSGSMILTAGSGFTNLLASETLTAGDLVNVFSGGVRRASSTDTTRRAHGFVTASYSATNPVIVFYSGLNTNVSGLTAGARYFLSASGAESTTPPVITGQLSQEIGVAISTTALLFQPGPAIIT